MQLQNKECLLKLVFLQMFSFMILIAWLLISFAHRFPRQKYWGKNIKAPGSLILFRLVCAIFLFQQQHTFHIDYSNRKRFTEFNPSLSASLLNTSLSLLRDVLGNIYYLYKEEWLGPVTCFRLSITSKFKRPNLKLPASFLIL